MGGFIESLRSRRLFQSAQRSAYFEREVNLVQELFEVVVAHRHAYELAITASMGILRGLPENALTSEKIPWERLKMLVGLYAPELQDTVKQFDDQAASVGLLMVQARMGVNLSGARKQELIDKLAESYKRLEPVYEKLQDALLQHSERLRSGMRDDAGLASLKIGAG